MTPETAELSRQIDVSELGRRIRRARQAAGLTQRQLADGLVTAAYVSRIEDGQRRPEATLLETMAGRMGVSVEELVVGVSADRLQELRLRLDHAELALAGGSARDALKACDALLAELDTSALEDLRREALQVKASALEAVGDLSAAIEALLTVTAFPRPTARWLKGLIALSRCYRDTGDLDRAIAVGEQARATIEELGLDGLTEAIQLAVTVAFAYMTRGDHERALAICERAIEEAERFDSPVAKASAYWNASVVQSRTGAVEPALTMARKALVIFELAEDARNLSRLRAQIANLQLEQDPPDAVGALRTLEQVQREMDWSSSSSTDRARQLLTKARAHHLLGDASEAGAVLEQVLALAPDNAVILRASAAAFQGEIHVALGEVDAARDSYRAAVAYLTAAGADRQAAQAWFELASLLSEVGETQLALDAFRRAGASTGLQLPASTRASLLK